MLEFHSQGIYLSLVTNPGFKFKRYTTLEFGIRPIFTFIELKLKYKHFSVKLFNSGDFSGYKSQIRDMKSTGTYSSSGDVPFLIKKNLLLWGNIIIKYKHFLVKLFYSGVKIQQYPILQPGIHWILGQKNNFT